MIGSILLSALAALLSPPQNFSNVEVTLLSFEAAKTLALSSEDRFQLDGHRGVSIDCLPEGGSLIVVEEGLKWGKTVFPSGKVTAIPPASGAIRVGKKRYRGAIEVQKQKDGTVRVLNRLSLEDYLRGVVPGEMPKASPLEALCAQAIAARTYAIAELRRGKPLADTVASQVYLGREGEQESTDAAVKKTAGLVLSYQDDIFLTYFHSTCGGHTGDPLAILGETTNPPLRGAVCGYCSEKSSKYFRWEAAVPASTLDEIVAEQKLGAKIVSISPAGKDPWGRWTSVKIAGDKKTGEMRGDLFRAAVNAKLAGASNLRSLNISDVTYEAGVFRIHGGGWGHGVGMCQIGAIEMAKLGFTFDLILSRYYPGATLAPIGSLEKGIARPAGAPPK